MTDPFTDGEVAVLRQLISEKIAEMPLLPHTTITAAMKEYLTFSDFGVQFNGSNEYVPVMHAIECAKENHKLIRLRDGTFLCVFDKEPEPK